MLGDDEEDAGDDDEDAGDNQENAVPDLPAPQEPPNPPPDFSVDSGNEPSTASGFPVSPDPPQQSPSDQTIIRPRTLDDEPPLRSPDDEAPENFHLPEDEEEPDGE